MIEPLKPTGGWKMFSEPKPNVTTSGFAFDKDGRFPVLFRSPKVRSARNVWSLPSGLHECGFSLGDQFCIELKEECGLTAYPQTVQPICIYENIAPDMPENPDAPQWHWVIHVLAVRVETLDTFINKEPDKHPIVKFLTVEELPDFLKYGKWHPSLYNALTSNYGNIVSAANLLHKFQPT
jgi:ADP-ribose pyrophosphatase YjhB (NUDIX family)